MKRVIVAISLEMMNQWDALEQGCIIGEYEVVFHSNPRMTIRKDRTFFNFDFAIDCGQTKIDGYLMSSVVPKDRLVIIPRFNKVEQHLRLREAVDNALLHDIDLSNFVAIDIYHNSQTNGNTHLLDIDVPVVVKPLDGARGIGQFLVRKPSGVLIKIVDAVNAVRHKRLAASEVIASLSAYSDRFVYSTKGERVPFEGIAAIAEDGICIQGFVPDIIGEYRLITDADCKIVYCQRRDIVTVVTNEDRGFPQAVGGGGDIHDEIPLEKVVREEEVEAIEYLAKAVVGPCSSIDLFVTADKRWGFFEYCNQFGVIGVRTAVVKGVCEGLLKKTIDGLDL